VFIVFPKGPQQKPATAYRGENGDSNHEQRNGPAGQIEVGVTIRTNDRTSLDQHEIESLSAANTTEPCTKCDAKEGKPADYPKCSHRA